MPNINGAKVLMPATILTGAAVREGDAIKRGADVSHAIQATANAVVLGVAVDSADAAERQLPYAYRQGEQVRCRSGAAVAIDVRVTSDATGRAVTATTGQNFFGIAREAATAADQYFLVELVSPFQLAP